MLDKIIPYLPYIYLGAISLVAVIVTLYDKAIARLPPSAEMIRSEASGIRSFGPFLLLFPSLSFGDTR